MCEAQSYRRGALCCKVKILTFQVTAHIGPLKGTPNAIKSVWEGSHFATYCPQPRLATGVAGACKMETEPKEGGKIKS